MKFFAIFSRGSSTRVNASYVFFIFARISAYDIIFFVFYLLLLNGMYFINFILIGLFFVNVMKLSSLLLFCLRMTT